ncbi:methyltransferase domain-containing protein [Cellulosimicrobium sp. NPDC057862]|uniref:class I SAM-dependent methyltransferase n=1 Tax=Cellulosimicrobium sp. NPDC057862 TaxID=3346266 RepID=UPI00366D05F7
MIAPVKSEALAADSSGLRLPRGIRHSSDSIDVLLDGERVWSFVPGRTESRAPVVPWPAVLQPYLVGRARVTVAESSTGGTLCSAEVAFSADTRRVDVSDPQGRRLAVNKWGHLGRTIEGSEGLADRILDRVDELLAVTTGLGLRPFVVGGTLLGAVRAGSLLPHDDDADLAYLSEHSNPADVALENSRIAASLRGLGFEVVRHSNAHLQIVFRRPDGELDCYVDLFAAFFTDGVLNQPFHVRGAMARSELTPFSTVTIDGRRYPAPADTNAWLTLNYDAQWRTPQPGYRLATPVSTSRRFRNWFGAYNFQREFWTARYEASVTAQPDDPDLRATVRLAQDAPAGSRVVELGCGTGGQAARLAELGFAVTAVDYCDAALTIARQRRGAPVTWRTINLIDTRDSAQLLVLAGSEPTPVHLVATHLVERVGHHARAQVWRLVRALVRRGGTMTFLFDTRPAPDVQFADPTTWHLTVAEVERELAAHGLRVGEIEHLTESGRDQQRRPVIVRITSSDDRHDH